MSTNNVRNKPVAINLDRKRHLVYDLNAFVSLEEEGTYESINQAFEDLQRGRIKAIRALLWAGLVHEDENLTVKDVGSLVTFGKLDEIVEKITKAIDASIPEPDPNSDPSPAK